MRGIANLDVEHESIELGFGKWIRSLLLDWILRGDREERIGEYVRGAADRDFALLHSLEQRGLGLGGRPVDFVGEQNIRKDRALNKSKFPSAGFVFIQDIGARDVRRHQIGCELNSLEFDI